jgi:protein PsiE
MTAPVNPQEPQPAAAPKSAQSLSRRLRRAVDPVGTLMSDTFHLFGLFVIGAATVWASAAAFMTMVRNGSPRLDDLLLLFIYLEIGAMVGIYFRTRHMPVRFLIYVAITALTRHMIVYVQHESEPDVGILYMAGGTLILAVAVLIIRYASYHFPSRSGVEATEDG